MSEILKFDDIKENILIKYKNKLGHIISVTKKKKGIDIGIHFSDPQNIYVQTTEFKNIQPRYFFKKKWPFFTKYAYIDKEPIYYVPEIHDEKMLKNQRLRNYNNNNNNILSKNSDVIINKAPHTPRSRRRRSRRSVLSIKQEGTKLSPIKESILESDSQTSKGGKRRITRRRK